MCHELLLSGRAICNIFPQRYPSITFSSYSHSYIFMFMKFPSSLSCVSRKVCLIGICKYPYQPYKQPVFSEFFLWVMIIQSCIPSLPGLGDLDAVTILLPDATTSVLYYTPKLHIHSYTPEVMSVAFNLPCSSGELLAPQYCHSFLHTLHINRSVWEYVLESAITKIQVESKAFSALLGLFKT